MQVKYIQYAEDKIYKMDAWLLSIVIITSVPTIINALPGGVITKEVNVGHLAELPCLSSDDHHRFMFWQLADDKNIIGPGNPLDQNKYNYEVLTGTLMIRAVSTAESGFYKCISRGINDNSAFNIQSVELIVRRDWDNKPSESDFETNLLRSLTAITIIAVVAAVILYIIQSKRRASPKLFEMDASRESSPVNYRDGLENANATTGTSAQHPSTGMDNGAVDIDFPKVFDRMRQEQAAILP